MGFGDKFFHVHVHVGRLQVPSPSSPRQHLPMIPCERERKKAAKQTAAKGRYESLTAAPECACGDLRCPGIEAPKRNRVSAQAAMVEAVAAKLSWKKK